MMSKWPRDTSWYGTDVDRVNKDGDLESVGIHCECRDEQEVCGCAGHHHHHWWR